MKTHMKLRFFDFICTITTNSSYVLDIIKNNYRAFIIQNDFPNTSDFDIDVNYNCEVYTIHIKNTNEIIKCDKRRVLGIIDYFIFEKFDEFPRENYWRIHASALVSENKALLLAGTSGSGKSTLSLTLAKMGFEYLTDDVTLIDKNTGMVKTFINPYHLKDGVFEVFDWIDNFIDRENYHLNYGDEKCWFLSPEDIAGIKIALPSRMRLIIFPYYSKGVAGVKVSWISATDIVGYLIHVLYCDKTREKVSQKIFEFLKSANQVGVRYIYLEYSNNEEAANIINKIVKYGGIDDDKTVFV